MRIKLFYLVIFLMPLFFVSCEEISDNELVPQNKMAKVNKFIWEVMDEVYLWQDKMPRNLDINKESDPKAYFEKLLYRTYDKWSFITDDVEGLLASFEGNEKTFGYSLTGGKFNNSDNYFMVVEYVEPNSPAALAGMKRGDIIVKINGQSITLNNYSELINGNTITITKGVYTESGITEGGTLTMTSKEMELNPVYLTNIIYAEGKKIGYIVYNQYIASYNKQLDNAFLFFKQEGVSDIVLDLRFNPGGQVNAAIHLCSIIAPEQVISKPEILIKKQWNRLYQEYWTKNNKTEQLQDAFDSKVAVNMNLSKIYILTSKGSASASELTISGLQPYMNVVTIGDATSGKYTASATFQPIINDKGDLDTEIKNWAIQPIIFKYSNAQGLTDFNEGLPASHKIKEILLAKDVPQLGDDDEPLLAKAVELITGKTTKAARLTTETGWTPTIRTKSKYDKQKQTLLIPATYNE